MKRLCAFALAALAAASARAEAGAAPTPAPSDVVEPEAEVVPTPAPRDAAATPPAPFVAHEGGAGPAPEVAKQERGAWFALPVVFSLPETSLSFGLTGGLHLIRPGLKTSSIYPTVFYTLKRQIYGEVAAEIYDSKCTVISAYVRAARFPGNFYGVGPDTPEQAKDGFTTRYAEVFLARQWAVGSALRLGPLLHVRAEELVQQNAAGALAASGLAPTGTYRTAGLGAVATYDDRDDLFWPTHGSLVEARALAYAADRQRRFARNSIVARTFAPLGGRSAVGLELQLESATGDVPFTLLPGIGGPLGLRGYYEGRFRDRFLWSTQAEWRFPIAWRLAGTVFGGAAGVAPGLGRLGEARPHAAAGAGVRFRLTSTGLNIRVDSAAGEEGALFYVTIGEAF